MKGFNTTDVLINPLATPGTPNLRGNAFIPNPSLMTIEMVSLSPCRSSSEHPFPNPPKYIEILTLHPGQRNPLPLRPCQRSRHNRRQRHRPQLQDHPGRQQPPHVRHHRQHESFARAGQRKGEHDDHWADVDSQWRAFDLLCKLHSFARGFVGEGLG